VKVARAIRHPNVCRVFDLGNVDEHWFVSMELASGGTLRDTLRAEPERPLSDRLADARAVCAGLGAMHTVGIVHRDVTPQNLLRMVDGRLVLSDFGLAIEGGVTTVHGGTPSYMAPETAMGQRPDQRSDVWQLGSVLHEIFFGRRPAWDSGPRGMRLKEPASSGASLLLKELAGLCRACLATNPSNRPGSATEAAARLAALEMVPRRAALFRILGHRSALLAGGVLIAALLGGTMLEHSFGRAAPRVPSQGLTPADRHLLRSMAEKLKARGQLDDARSLARLAGADDSP
jgi:serine/threonine protein kinase